MWQLTNATLRVFVLFFLCAAVFIVHAKNNIQEFKVEDKTRDQFFDAIQDNNLEQLKKLVETGVPLNIRNYEDKTAIEAVLGITGYIKKRKEVVEYLVNQGADIHVTGGMRETLLHEAVGSDMHDTVTLLLQKGIDTSATNAFGQSAMFYAQSKEMLELLIKSKSFSLKDTDKDGNTLLHNACGLNPRLDLVEFLIKHVDIDTPNDDGNSALIQVVSSDYFPDEVEKVAEFLIKHGADVNFNGQYGRTPFQEAVSNRKLNISLLDKLIAAGADLNHEDNNGLKAIHFTAASNLGYLKYLVSKGADVNAMSSNTRGTPLTIATEYNREATVQYLLENGAKVNHQDEYGRTALNFALDGDFSDVVMLLETHDAVATDQSVIDANMAKKPEVKKPQKNVEITDIKSAIKAGSLQETKKYFSEKLSSDDFTKEARHEIAVHAIYDGTLEIFKYLVENGIDIETEDEEGVPLLHEAVYDDNIALTRYILSRGIYINDVADDGTSTIRVAMSSSREMMAFLLENGLMAIPAIDSDLIKSAMSYGNAEMTRYQMEKGEKLDQELLKNRDYIYKLIQYQKADMLSILADNGLDLEMRLRIYGEEATLLHFAVIIKTSEVARLLLEKGANPDARNTDDEPVFVQAINNGLLDVLEAMYEQGANINDSYGRENKTPLGTALELQRIKTINMLVDKGADVNQRFGFRETTALHLAAQKGYLQALKRMIKKGGDITLVDKDGKSPLDVAIEYKQKAVTAYLQSL